MASVVLRPHPDLDRLLEMMDAASKVALDLDPRGQLAKRLVEIVERGLGFRSIERKIGATADARNVEMALAPDLAERDWRFLAALRALHVNCAGDHGEPSLAA